MPVLQTFGSRTVWLHRKDLDRFFHAAQGVKSKALGREMQTLCDCGCHQNGATQQFRLPLDPAGQIDGLACSASTSLSGRDNHLGRFEADGVGVD